MRAATGVGRTACAEVDAAEHALEEVRRQNGHMIMADRLASLGQLSAGIAHEMNNLLAVVRGNLEVAMSELASLDVPASVMEPLQDAIAASERVQHIVRDVKLFSRVDEDDRRLVDVCGAVASTLRLAAKQLGCRGRLEVDLQPVPDVEANPARLGQVVLNLVVNAIQAIPEGDAVRAGIRVATRWDGTHVVIAVTDNGTGIPEAVRARVFEPFFTTKAAGVGTGLGLSICHQIVTGLGGSIEFTTEIGRGTEFRVLLPVPTVRTRRTTIPPAAGTRGR